MLVGPTAAPPEAPRNEDVLPDCGAFVFRDEAILGTRMQIELTARDHADALAAAQNARHEIDRLNAILNSRDAQSELCVLNRSRTHRASPELFAVVSAAEQWRTRTDGAFSGRMGRAIELWHNALNETPSRSDLARVADEAESARVVLDPSTRTITRPNEVEFALDALAKGWIVDRAFEVAMASPGVYGALVDIGGDIRCGGRAPDSRGWCVGISDATIPADNAPLISTVQLRDHAIATSGRGPRDRFVDGVRYSPTLSPQTGWPVEHTVSATAIASNTADADAIATAVLTMPPEKARTWADRNRIDAQIVTKNEIAYTPTNKTASQIHFAQLAKEKPKAKKDANAWPKDWVALFTFTAPPKQLTRDQHFRAPYMAMWVTDANDKPIRTLLLVGREGDWQKDNYIWWSVNDANVPKLLSTRSMSTSGSGVYKMLWDGTDDDYKPVPGGQYTLHVETSRERGRHTHRTLVLDFSKPNEFYAELPTSEEAGSLRIDFHRP